MGNKSVPTLPRTKQNHTSFDAEEVKQAVEHDRTKWQLNAFTLGCACGIVVTIVLVILAVTR